MIPSRRITARRSLTILAGLLVALSVAVTGAAAPVAPGPAAASGPSAEADRVPVIVGFHGSPDADLVRRHGGDITYEYTLIPAVAATLPEPASEQLRRNPRVEYVERDRRVQWLDQTVPWGIDRVNATDVHAADENRAGADVDVAVLDTGIDYFHDDLDGNYAGGHDFVNDDSDPGDDNGHGTHVAGTVAAEDNEIGVVGVAPESDLYAVKVLNDSGSGSISDVVAGIEWAVRGPDGVYDTTDDSEVVSMSLGTNLHFTSLEDAVDAAYANGSLVVAAAGNDGSSDGTGDTVDYPARYDAVIAVAATNRSNVRASFSSTGSAVELAAPGVEIVSTYPGDRYAWSSGTSMATPHVSGLAALVYHSLIAPGYDTDSDGEWDNDEVRQRLRDTAIELGASGRDTWYGFGLVNSTAAVGAQARPLAGTGALDGDDDGRRLAHLHTASDPADSGRAGVVHLTSHGDSTGDYALSVVDVSGQSPTLGDVTGVEFDYYEGPNNTDAAPDEVWLVVEDGTGDRHVVFTTINDGAFPDGRWSTQDVVPALTDSDQQWIEVAATGPTPNPREALSGLSEDDLAAVGTNLTAAFGPDAEILAVGVGHGAPLSGPTTVDLYVDDLRVNGQRYEFPVATVEVEPDPLALGGSDDVTATVDLEGDWGGRTVRDVNPNTIELNGTPAISGSATLVNADSDSADELTVSFDRDAVEADLAPGEDVPATVDGIFNGGTVAFAATDHVEVRS